MDIFIRNVSVIWKRTPIKEITSYQVGLFRIDVDYLKQQQQNLNVPIVSFHLTLFFLTMFTVRVN